MSDPRNDPDIHLALEGAAAISAAMVASGLDRSTSAAIIALALVVGDVANLSGKPSAVLGVFVQAVADYMRDETRKDRT